MHNLNPVTGWPRGRTKAYCVPSSLSALTGAPYATCAEACVRNGAAETYDELSGVDLVSTLLALHELKPDAKVEAPDLQARYPDLRCGPTLRRYMQEQPIEEKMTPCLITINTHMIVAHMGYLGGNDVDAPVPWTLFPRLNRLVNDVRIVRGL